MASNFEVVSMTADTGSDSDHARFFSSVIGHLEAELGFLRSGRNY
jgi:hypothetical protein